MQSQINWHQFWELPIKRIKIPRMKWHKFWIQVSSKNRIFNCFGASICILVINYNALLQTAVFNTNEFCPGAYGTAANYPYLPAYAHSNYAGGCGPTYDRSLFTLLEIDQISVGALNNSTAILKLFGASANETGNPFQAYGGEGITNEAVLRRVTSAWAPTNLTWARQPTTTTINQVVIPATTVGELYNVTLDLTQLVRDIRRGGPQRNYGLQLSLMTEFRYRVVNFCSSRHPEVSRRPKLMINGRGWYY